MSLILRNKRLELANQQDNNDFPSEDRDEKVKVSPTDTTADYLFNKIIPKEGRQTVMREIINKSGEQFLRPHSRFVLGQYLSRKFLWR